MNKFSVFAILNILLIIIGTGLLLKDLYTLYNNGKIIIKVKGSKGLTIFWLVSLIFWCLLSWSYIKLYIHYEENSIINNIIINIFWIELSISNILRSLRSSEIRENGIYKSGYFYKWSKIRSYSWVLPNTIEFKVNTVFKTNSTLEFTINEEFKLKVDEVIQRNLAL
ncbi:hypothetical protein psyc5s11_33380 [Clostridium gelidum]|uniref:DUF5673 domain-containing protein n=1 Tax=Clostridium gelidum TaxID=704125 RepID=A0ABM7T7L2_9CLOT|nr:DUF5673 domain-containing protein [Clostridium gelidum]BCZ47271.1 hypothetical protein psyc5s11_33380 [Clostridium gelidum]